MFVQYVELFWGLHYTLCLLAKCNCVGDYGACEFDGHIDALYRLIFKLTLDNSHEEPLHYFLSFHYTSICDVFPGG